jgi:hypothetical protein
MKTPPSRERLAAYFERTCRAVALAPQKGVLHTTASAIAGCCITTNHYLLLFASCGCYHNNNPPQLLFPPQRQQINAGYQMPAVATMLVVIFVWFSPLMSSQ